MTRDHPVMGFTRWFAWHRVPVTDNKTAWLCMVERGIFWNGTCAFWVWRLPPKKDVVDFVMNVTPTETPFTAANR